MDLNVAASNAPPAVRYAKCVEVSKRIRWDIERDVFRGRRFDYSKKFLPDGLSLVDRLTCLDEVEILFHWREESQHAILVLKAYRWQYIISGVQEPRFSATLENLTTAAQRERIVQALAPIMQ